MQSDDVTVFPVALNLRGRPVLVLGGAEEASEKVPKLIAAGAHVKIVAPALSSELSRLARTRALSWYAREFRAQDVQGVQFVMLTEQDPERARELRRLAQLGRFWVAALDQPEYSDMYLMSVVRSGPVQVAISTGGQAPLLARRIREGLARALDGEFGEFARKMGRLRTGLRDLPRVERTRQMARALAGFAMEVHVRYPDGDGQGAGDPSNEARDMDVLARRGRPLE